ncbi:MFS transporter [Streptomyces sp. NBC_00006]|uniref:MFS transporter n=1 Tax=unclassified Streptomyces TaxID=2593676 RepID=UPI002257D90B|nr:MULTISPECIES: MFS transporter [unclassified Streptomyces]MCX5535818.1 MFS transporter [Streptomyces sp. NBC_00006]
MTGRPGLPGSGRGSTAAVTLGTLVLCVEGYDLFVLGAVGPALLNHPQWHVTGSTLGLLGSLTALGMPLGSIAAGWAGDLRGRRLPMAASLVWLSLWMLLSATAGDLGFFAVTRFATGIGLGALIPLVTAYVSESAVPARRSVQVGAGLSGVAIGGIVSGVLGRVLLPGWDFHTMFLFGVFPLLLVPMVWRLVPAPTGRAPSPEADVRTADSGPPRQARNRAARLLTPAYRRATLLFWGATFSGLVLVYGAGTWLPALMVRAGYDLSSSLEFSVAFNAGAVLGTLGAAVLADRGFLKTATVTSFVLAALAMAVLSAPQPRPVLLLASAFAGLGALGTQNLVNIAVARFYPAELRGTGLGFSLGVGRLGAIVGPSYLAAVTALVDSPEAGFYAFAAPAVLGALLSGMFRGPQDTHTGRPTSLRPASTDG